MGPQLRSDLTRGHGSGSRKHLPAEQAAAGIGHNGPPKDVIPPTKRWGASFADVAIIAGESVWTSKDKARRGIYEVRKSGRRSIVVLESVYRHLSSLPKAVYAPPVNRKKQGTETAS